MKFEKANKFTTVVNCDGRTLIYSLYTDASISKPPYQQYRRVLSALNV